MALILHILQTNVMKLEGQQVQIKLYSIITEFSNTQIKDQ